MIYAEANFTVDNRVRMVLCYPDAQENKAITVADESEARRLVYFHNRQYIKLHLTEWLAQRVHAFQHADYVDNTRIMAAGNTTEAINNHSNALHVLCRKIIEKTPVLLKLAPSTQSRHYGRYQETILPIIKFCHELQGQSFDQA